MNNSAAPDLTLLFITKIRVGGERKMEFMIYEWLGSWVHCQRVSALPKFLCLNYAGDTFWT